MKPTQGGGKTGYEVICFLLKDDMRLLVTAGQ